MMFMAAKPATATRLSRYFWRAVSRSCLAASIGAATKPALLERGDEINLAGERRVVGDAEPLGGERGPRRLHASNSERRTLDRAHAAAAMHVLDGERQRASIGNGVCRLRPFGEAPGRGVDGHGWSGM